MLGCLPTKDLPGRFAKVCWQRLGSGNCLDSNNSPFTSMTNSAFYREKATMAVLPSAPTGPSASLMPGECVQTAMLFPTGAVAGIRIDAYDWTTPKIGLSMRYRVLMCTILLSDPKYGTPAAFGNFNLFRPSATPVPSLTKPGWVFEINQNGKGPVVSTGSINTIPSPDNNEIDKQIDKNVWYKKQVGWMPPLVTGKLLQANCYTFTTEAPPPPPVPDVTVTGFWSFKFSLDPGVTKEYNVGSSVQNMDGTAGSETNAKTLEKSKTNTIKVGPFS